MKHFYPPHIDSFIFAKWPYGVKSKYVAILFLRFCSVTIIFKKLKIGVSLVVFCAIMRVS